MPFLFFDATYILVIIGAVISLACSFYLQHTYSKYGQKSNSSGLVGAEFADKMLNSAGIFDVKIVPISGHLTDNYHPGHKTLNLSQSVFRRATIGAVAVAGHEAGHAIQHQESYWAMRLRTWLVPVVNFGSMLSIPIIVVGMIFSFNQTLINIGLILFSLTFVFQLITLPVEFGASKKALASIDSMHIMGDEERKYAKKVLRAAALTYVASATASLLSLLRMMLLFGDRDRD